MKHYHLFIDDLINPVIKWCQAALNTHSKRKDIAIRIIYKKNALPVVIKYQNERRPSPLEVKAVTAIW